MKIAPVPLALLEPVLPRECHDVRADFVLTEDALYAQKGGGRGAARKRSNMRGTLTLPDGYAGCAASTRKRDKRLALLINGLALLINGLVLLIALPLVFGQPDRRHSTRFSMDDGFGFIFRAWHADGRVCGICWFRTNWRMASA